MLYVFWSKGVSISRHIAQEDPTIGQSSLVLLLQQRTING